MRLLQDISGLDPWVCSSAKLKQVLHQQEMVEIPKVDRWRLKYLSTLLAQKQELYYMGFNEESMSHVTTLIDSLCTS